jgi:hypothetical protein
MTYRLSLLPPKSTMYPQLRLYSLRTLKSTTSFFGTSAHTSQTFANSSMADIQGKYLVHTVTAPVLTGCRSAMGMAAIGVALYKYVMKFSPKNGSYFNRDRFVLSNGKLP